MRPQSPTLPLFAGLPSKVVVYEVGPRDGLQNEQRMIATADKIALVNGLSQTGLAHIEVTSFVNPKWIPQLSDSSQVARGIARRPGVAYSALVPNRRGLDHALEAGLTEIAVFLSASETHNKKNINKSRHETLAAFAEVVPPALQAGMRVRAYISTVFGCPYEGPVEPQQTVALAEKLFEMGAYQVSLGDTIGVANPRQVAQVLQALDTVCEKDRLALHFHDTRGTALANVLVGLQLGITTIDSAIGGLGGCPYAPGAGGNLATEDLVYMLNGMGIETGVKLDSLVDCARQIGTVIGKELPSKYLKAHLAAQARRTQ